MKMGFFQGIADEIQGFAKDARNAVESIGGDDAVKTWLQNELKILTELAESKAEFLELQLLTSLRTAGSTDNLTVPVESVIESTSHTFASAKSGLDDSLNKIPKTVQSFINGISKGDPSDIVTGICDNVGTALAIFLGTGSASTNTDKWYYVYTEGLSIVRIDIYAWYRDIEAAGLQSKVEKAGAFSMTKSIVNISKLHFNTFLNLYQKQLKSQTLPPSTIEEEIKKAKSIMDCFKE